VNPPPGAPAAGDGTVPPLVPGPASPGKRRGAPRARRRESCGTHGPGPGRRALHHPRRRHRRPDDPRPRAAGRGLGPARRGGPARDRLGDPRQRRRRGLGTHRALQSPRRASFGPRAQRRRGLRGFDPRPGRRSACPVARSALHRADDPLAPAPAVPAGGTVPGGRAGPGPTVRLDPGRRGRRRALRQRAERPRAHVAGRVLGQRRLETPGERGGLARDLDHHGAQRRSGRLRRLARGPGGHAATRPAAHLGGGRRRALRGPLPQLDRGLEPAHHGPARARVERKVRLADGQHGSGGRGPVRALALDPRGLRLRQGELRGGARRRPVVRHAALARLLPLDACPGPPRVPQRARLRRHVGRRAPRSRGPGLPRPRGPARLRGTGARPAHGAASLAILRALVRVRGLRLDRGPAGQRRPGGRVPMGKPRLLAVAPRGRVPRGHGPGGLAGRPGGGPVALRGRRRRTGRPRGVLPQPPERRAPLPVPARGLGPGRGVRATLRARRC
jgi:hypothetical protein